jgi:hypothetical protein
MAGPSLLVGTRFPTKVILSLKLTGIVRADRRGATPRTIGF